MLDTALDCIIAMDSAGTVLEFNPAAERVFGYRRDEAVGRELAELIVPERMRERHRRGLAHYLQTGEGPMLGRRIEIDALRRDGTEILVELAITALRLDGIPFFIAYLRDITERVRTERRRAAQYAVASLLAGPQSLAEIAPQIIETIAASGKWSLGAIWLQKEGEDHLSCDAIWHLPEPAMREFAEVTRETRLLPGAGLPGRVWTAKKALCVQDVAVDRNFQRAPAAARAGLHGAFGFPLTARNVVKGVLELYSPEPLEPDEDLLQLVESLGTQIGLFIYRRWIETQMGMLV
ncbi:MAG: PAS domain S-box protein [Chthoniobacterales bacterium]